MKKNYFLIACILFLIVSFLLILFFSKKKELIKIGFVGALTSKYSDLGNPMMNGIILAFEEEKYEINGKKIEPNQFIIDSPIPKVHIFNDLKGAEHKVLFNFIQIKKVDKIKAIIIE